MDMVSGMSISWIPDLALTGMWPRASLGVICEMTMLAIIFHTIIVKMICNYGVRCLALA